MQLLKEKYALKDSDEKEESEQFEVYHTFVDMSMLILGTKLTLLSEDKKTTFIYSSF